MNCSQMECPRSASRRGMCEMHYRRLMRTGSTERRQAYSARGMSVQGRMDEVGWTVTATGCWEWNGPRDNFGYGSLYAEGCGQKAHRAVYKHLVGPIGEDLVLRHRCDNPPCVNPDHLTPGTHADNVNDMVERRRFVAKITDQQVLEIRAMRDRGMTLAAIANEIGSTVSNIQAIASRRTRKYLP